MITCFYHKKGEYMLIQKINTANLIKSNNKQKFSNPIEKNKIYTYDKNIGIKDIPFYYPISFGAVEKTDTKIDFQDSLKKYFRLSPDKYQIQSAKSPPTSPFLLPNHCLL